MYIQLINHFPALGQTAEVSVLLQEQVKTANKDGLPLHALSSRMLGSKPTLTVAIQYEDLSVLEAFEARRLADASLQAWGTKLHSLLSRPQSTELHTVIGSFTPTGPVDFRWSVTFYPALGKNQDVSRLLAERATSAINRGATSAMLLSRAFSPDGTAFTMSFTFQDLAALEAYQRALQADPSFLVFSAAIAPLLARPNEQTLLKTLIPFPPS